MPRLTRKRGATPATAPGGFRVGQGFDSHRFARGGPLVLGGVRIPVDYSLVGHSDGDAVAHALTDAVLGAASLGDIGEMFSNTDEANRGRNSIAMLRLAVARVRAKGFRVVNADVTVIAETPRLTPHRKTMAARLGKALGVGAANVSIKGKTNEQMGALGRGEGLACLAIVLLAHADA